MANLFKREFRPENAGYEITRSVQSSSVYLMDLFGRKKLFFIAALSIVSVVVFIFHRSHVYTAKNLITIQLDNLTQSGLVLPTDMSSLLGKTDNLRDRQIVFLGSYDFKRLLAKKIKDDPEIVARLIGSGESLKISVLKEFGKAQAKKETLSFLAQRLQELVRISANNDNNIQIEVLHAEASFAKELSDLVTNQALYHIKKSQFQNIEVSQKNLDVQIIELKSEIEDISRELFDFKTDNKIISTSTLPEDLKNSLSNLSRSLVESEIKLQETNLLLAELEAQVSQDQQKATQAGQPVYIDQVVLMKIQELKDAKSNLEAKIKGTRRILRKENKKFEFYTSGEETISSLRKKINEKQGLLSQLEQKLKQNENVKAQIDFAVRLIGEPYVQMKSGQFPLPVKLLILNLFAILLMGMGLFYWYEAFPVISYKDESVVQMNLLAAPYCAKEGFGKGLTVQLVHQANRLFAQSLVARLGKAGVYQFLSISPKEGKSHLVSIVAEYLASHGEKVSIVDLTRKGHYRNLPKEVTVISKSNEIESFLKDPSSLNYFSKESDWIFVDSYSLEKDIGHMLVTSRMDGIILIGSYLETKRDQFVDWRLKLEHMASPSVHFVLNKTNLREEMPFLLKAQMKKEKTTLRKVS